MWLTVQQAIHSAALDDHPLGFVRAIISNLLAFKRRLTYSEQIEDRHSLGSIMARILVYKQACFVRHNASEVLVTWLACVVDSSRGTLLRTRACALGPFSLTLSRSLHCTERRNVWDHLSFAGGPFLSGGFMGRALLDSKSPRLGMYQKRIDIGTPPLGKGHS